MKDKEKDIIQKEENIESPRKKRRTKVWLIILLMVVALIAALAVFVAMLPRTIIEENVQQEEELEEVEVEVTPNLPPPAEVHNIALFGIDQEKGSVGRSDAVMILSIDRTNNKIKMITLDRDSLVAIDDHGEEKLTHAWAYGHGKLAVKTLNQNFGMNITDYAYVNFTEFVNAIDYMGGVHLDVTAKEQKYMNDCWIEWVDTYNDWETPKVTGTGRVLLNGAQALTYARNRSDGTTNRGGRHREVLLALYERVKSQPLTKLPAILTKMLQLCHTNMKSAEILDIARWALTSAPTFESLSLPNSQLKPWGGVIDRQRGWVRVYDLDAATDILHNFIYESDKTVTGVTEYIPPSGTTTAATKKEETTTTVAP